MTNFTIYSSLIVLIISTHGILNTEGSRVLKPTKKQEQNVHQHPLRNTDGVPSASQRPVSQKKPTFPPPIAAQNQGKQSSEPEPVNDFRPTTPGNSPGIGHSFAENRLDARSETMDGAPAMAKSTAANGDDFRPTGPGHSPGGGHSKDGQIVKPNGADSRPTAPGHSPGGGHSKDNQIVKPFN